VALVAAPMLVTADDDTSLSGGFDMGAWYIDAEGSPDMVSEYEPNEGMPILGLDLENYGDWGSILVSAHWRHSDDAEGTLDFDIKRMIRSHTTYNKLLHRLGHDPMTNLEATSFNGKVVWHEDFHPDQDYDISYSVLNSRTEFQLASLNALTLGVEVREQRRVGHKQAFAVSHCDTCHVKSKSHPIDESTTDATLDAKFAWTGGFVKASFTSRELNQGNSHIMVQYDKNLHPEAQTPIFDNRMQYDSDVGFVMADLWPDMEKTTTRLDLNFDNVGGFAINGGGVWSETENDYTGLKSDYAGYMINAARRMGDKGRLRWRGRIYSIDNDDVYVDTNERVTPAGPHAGLTYEDTFGVNFDWWRLSAMNRDVVESKLDYSYRVSKKAGTFRAIWDYTAIDRENYQVAPGQYDTTTNILGLTWRARPVKGLKLNAHVKHGDIDNPFMLVDGACSTLESQAYPNPWSPETPQYHDQHDARIGDTTASASNWDEFKIGANYTVGSTTASGTYRYWSGDNNDGDLTNWARDNSNLTLTLWSAPTETYDWYVAYAYQESSLDSHLCIPVFDG